MLRTTLGTLLAGAFLTVAVSGPARAGDACQIAKDATTEVGKACKEGGIKRAKSVMKAMMKQAKEKGLKMDCDGCHKNEESWELNGEAKDKYKDLLKTIGKDK